MDYDNMTYAEAKLAIKTAGWQEDVQNWLANMGEQAQASWANPEHKPYWDIGLGAAGGAGLGALSSLWQPKNRRNALGRTLTGGMLGGLGGGLYNALSGGLAEAQADTERGNLADQRRDLESSIGARGEGAGAGYEDMNWFERLAKTITGGEREYTDPAGKTQTVPVSRLDLLQTLIPGLGSLKEDISGVTSGEHVPLNYGQPEANAVVAALADRALQKGHRGTGKAKAHVQSMLSDAPGNPLSADAKQSLKDTIEAQKKLGAKWSLRHGPVEAQVLKGQNAKPIPAQGVNVGEPLPQSTPKPSVGKPPKGGGKPPILPAPQPQPPQYRKLMPDTTGARTSSWQAGRNWARSQAPGGGTRPLHRTRQLGRAGLVGLAADLLTRSMIDQTGGNAHYDYNAQTQDLLKQLDSVRAQQNKLGP